MPLDPNGPLTQYRNQIDQHEVEIAQINADLSAINVQVDEVARGESFITQEPAGTDVPLQLTFGAGSSTPEFNIDGAGNVTCLIAGQYQFRFRLLFGRTGAGGESLVYARALLNGVQVGSSVHSSLDDGNFNVPATFEGVLTLSVNDVLTVEIMRSSAGNNSGGVFTEPSPLAGWAASPSCLVQINRAQVTF